MAEPAIRVLIVDDHPVVRSGLRAFLSTREGLEVVGEAADGEQAIAEAARLGPDIVLMDLRLPGIGGVEATRRISAVRDGTRVLVLTSYGGDDQVVAAVRAGASGYLLKDVEPEDLEAAIRAVHRGQVLLGREAAAALVAAGSGAAASAGADPVGMRLASLTPREREVLELLARGETNRRIGRALGIAEKTVKAHVGAVLSKLGVQDRTQAAVLAVRAELDS